MCSAMRSGLVNTAAFAALATACAAHAQTRTIYVDASAPLGGDGTSWEAAYQGLAEAFGTVLNADLSVPIEFRIAQGTYRPEMREGFRVDVRSTNSTATLTIRGGYAGRSSLHPDARDFVGTPTILSGDVLGNDNGTTASRADNASVVLGLSSETMRWSRTLDGLIIRSGGSPALHGAAAVAAFADSPEAYFTIRDCIIEDNYSDYLSAGVSFEHRQFEANATSITILRSTFRNNHAAEAGGALRLAVYQGASAALIRIDRCVFENNSASGGGGAQIVNMNGVTIANSIFRGNIARLSGAAFVAPNLTMTNCLVTGNASTSLHHGGIIHSNLASITNSTIAHNHAPVDTAINFGTVSLTNCIVKSNVGQSGASGFTASSVGTLVNSALDLRLDASGRFLTGGVLSQDSRLLPDMDPRFIDPDGPDNNPATWADNNLRLSPRSPAVDAGHLETSLSIVDLDGNDRFVSGMIGRPTTLDLGCYESQASLCPADLTADNAVTIDDLLAFLDAFESGGWLADLSSGSSTAFPDGGVTVDDLLFFLASFEGGC